MYIKTQSRKDAEKIKTLRLYDFAFSKISVSDDEHLLGQNQMMKMKTLTSSCLLSPRKWKS